MSGTTPARPRYRVETIPAELQALDRWCTFQIVRDSKGKQRKLPLIAGVRHWPGARTKAECDDPATWRPFAAALADAAARGLYLAFCFDRGVDYVFIDADDAWQSDDTLRPDVALVVDSLDTYTERSQSGAGLHIIGRGRFPERPQPRPFPEGAHPLELYPLRGARWGILTGDVLPGHEAIAARQSALDALFPTRRERPFNDRTAGVGYHGPAGDLTPAEVERIVAWAAPLWINGRRHHLALFLAGELGRQGVSRKQAVAIIEQCAAGDSDPAAKTNACHGTYDNLEAGETVSGWYGLRDVCGLPEDDLASLSGVLHGFWQRSRPPSGGVRTRSSPIRMGAPRLRVRAVSHD